MRYIEIDGLRVSRIGLGTWQFGTREWGYGEVYARDTAPALIRRAAELGVTMIDTAEGYGPGRSERIIGETLATMSPADRDALIIATKFTPIAPAGPIVAWQARGSRRRLDVDALDLLYVHWPNLFVSVRRVMQSMRPLLEGGSVRRIGVSNHSLEQWREAERALGSPVIANQVRFSLATPEPRRDLVPFAAEHDRLIVAYSPLGQGLLAGAGMPGAVGAAESETEAGAAASGPDAGMSGARQSDVWPDRARRPGHKPRVRARNPIFRDSAKHRAVPLLTAVREVAAAHDATAAQVALAWVIHHPNTIAIPGARTLGQLEENVAAVDLVLSDEELARLSSEAEVFAQGH